MKSCNVEAGSGSVIQSVVGLFGPNGTQEWDQWIAKTRLTKNAIRLLESVLPTFWFGNKRICTYCGADAESRDHVIPWSFQKTTTRRGLSASGPMTHCCKFCNSFLSNRFFSDFRTRCEFIQHYMNRMAKPIEWHEWQMRKLDYTLRSYVRSEQQLRLWYRLRADWYEGRGFLLNIESLLWEPHLKRGSALFHKPLYDYFWSTINMLELV